MFLNFGLSQLSKYHQKNGPPLSISSCVDKSQKGGLIEPIQYLLNSISNCITYSNQLKLKETDSMSTMKKTFLRIYDDILNRATADWDIPLTPDKYVASYNDSQYNLECAQILIGIYDVSHPIMFYYDTLTKFIDFRH